MSSEEHIKNLSRKWFNDAAAERLYPECRSAQYARAFKYSNWCGTEVYEDITYEMRCIERRGKIGGCLA